MFYIGLLLKETFIQYCEEAENYCMVSQDLEEDIWIIQSFSEFPVTVFVYCFSFQVRVNDNHIFGGKLSL